jgi:serine/threonine-protein kinase RsbW
MSDEIRQRQFERRFEALDALFAFTAEVAAEGLPSGVHQTVDLALEELFTNIVKYGRGQAPVSVTLTRVPGGLEVVLDDPDAEDFDVTRAPDADTSLPLELRQPGGLGLHLIRRMLDSIEYQYVAERRHSRIRFRKTSPQGSGGLNACA